MTATCGRRLWAAGARCALSQPPSACSPRSLHWVPPSGGGGRCLGPQCALLLRGRCAGSAAGCVGEARTRLLRSKITAREPGLRCAPVPRPSALPDTTRAGVAGTEGGCSVVSGPRLRGRLWAPRAWVHVGPAIGRRCWRTWVPQSWEQHCVIAGLPNPVPPPPRTPLLYFFFCPLSFSFKTSFLFGERKLECLLAPVLWSQSGKRAGPFLLPYLTHVKEFSMSPWIQEN